jgi:DivIVA domain-containing protein
MDITSQSIREARFHASLRGYNMSEVDALLAEIADAVDQAEGMGAKTHRGARTPIAAGPWPATPQIDVAEAARSLLAQAENRAEVIVAEAENRAIAATEVARAAANAALIELDQLRARIGVESGPLPITPQRRSSMMGT